MSKKTKIKGLSRIGDHFALIIADAEILSKIRAQNLKMYLPSLIFSKQFYYVDKRLITKSGRRTSDLLEISHIMKLNGLLATIDIEQRDI